MKLKGCYQKTDNLTTKFKIELFSHFYVNLYFCIVLFIVTKTTQVTKKQSVVHYIVSIYTKQRVNFELLFTEVFTEKNLSTPTVSKYPRLNKQKMTFRYKRQTTFIVTRFDPTACICMCKHVRPLVPQIHSPRTGTLFNGNLSHGLALSR